MFYCIPVPSFNNWEFIWIEFRFMSDDRKLSRASLIYSSWSASIFFLSFWFVEFLSPLQYWLVTLGDCPVKSRKKKQVHCMMQSNFSKLKELDLSTDCDEFVVIIQEWISTQLLHAQTERKKNRTRACHNFCTWYVYILNIAILDSNKNLLQIYSHRWTSPLQGESYYREKLKNLKKKNRQSMKIRQRMNKISLLSSKVSFIYFLGALAFFGFDPFVLDVLFEAVFLGFPFTFLGLLAFVPLFFDPVLFGFFDSFVSFLGLDLWRSQYFT